GDKLDTLDKTADGVTAALGTVKGIVDLQFKRQSGTPTIAIHLIPPALAATGLKVTDVLDTIEAAYAGTLVGQTFQGTRTVDVVALL
ncbi:efflux RND transporter permease subunit, partial [Acinetobacter baumannii]